MANLPFFQGYIYGFALQVMAWIGKAHGVDTGAKRYIDAATDSENYQTGVFYGSEKGVQSFRLLHMTALFAMIMPGVDSC